MTFWVAPEEIGPDDIGYEWYREAKLAAAEEPPAVLRLVPPLPPATEPPARCDYCRSKIMRCFCPLPLPVAKSAAA